MLIQWLLDDRYPFLLAVRLVVALGERGSGGGCRAGGHPGVGGRGGPAHPPLRPRLRSPQDLAKLLLLALSKYQVMSSLASD